MCRIGDRPVCHPPFDLAAGNEYRRTRSFESPMLDSTPIGSFPIKSDRCKS
jgi:hypothetical protein